MEEYNLYENYYVLLRDCTNLEVSRASSKILRRYFRRGREATWRFLESTFLDFQRNYYPCINYNPAQGSLLYSNGLEHCQYPVSTSPISIPVWIYITWEQSTWNCPIIWKPRKPFPRQRRDPLIAILKLLSRFALRRATLHLSIEIVIIPFSRSINVRGHDSYRVFPPFSVGGLKFLKERKSTSCAPGIKIGKWRGGEKEKILKRRWSIKWRD